MIEAVTGLLTRRNEPADARPELPAQPDHAGPVSGVALGRLLAAAILSPAQASLLVADALDQLEPARSDGPDRIRLRNVTVSDSGHLTIEYGRGAVSGQDVNEEVAGLFRSIATNCRSSALPERLHESLVETTDLDALLQRVRLAIEPGVDPAEESRKRCQIARLVAATKGRPRPDGRTVEEPPAGEKPPSAATGSTLASPGWFPPVRNPWHRRKRRHSRRQGAFGLVAILILFAAVWMAPRAWSELRRGWDAVLNPVNPEEQNQIRPVSPPPEPPADQAAPATTEAGRVPPPVDVGAPGSAGPITLVTATRANGECGPGQACEIRVDVHLDPAATVDAVTWRVNVYDRCSGEVRAGGDVSERVQSGTQQVYGIVRTDLPPGTALAVAAITSAPATAASEPLLIPAENARC
ncbi:hypothetical protein JWS13_43760 [Rhodococcus pseudokoreensis]|uniref:Uncharacterized protein n=1 Tax=Rhodococcus pseudokoreensis TaxID=2811421 RepID=A0A974WBT7_9NOCA|nr:hypothetical protein [Rhodococcus pseudokoreensis]QSE95038.1 hypothetical protein JWS13_43760 [Rhodococcus pseudokoreensis]